MAPIDHEKCLLKQIKGLTRVILPIYNLTSLFDGPWVNLGTYSRKNECENKQDSALHL